MLRSNDASKIHDAKMNYYDLSAGSIGTSGISLEVNTKNC
jgi:hypothetical protein